MWIRQNGVLGCCGAEVSAAGKQTGRGTLFLALLFIAALAAGCNKPAPPAAPLLPPPVETVARIHWLGMKRLAVETNAAFFMGIWNLAESKQLETQTLDRLAMGLVASNQLPVIDSQASSTNHPPPLIGLAAILRPLLEDLVQEESYLEVRQATNQPGDMALAIRLGDERAGVWQTNLAAVLELLTGVGPTPVQDGRGWVLPVTNNQLSVISHQSSQSSATRYVELVRVKDWTVIGLGRETNVVVGELGGLILRDGQPFARQPKDFWLYADIDLRRVASALTWGWQLPAGLPRLTVTAIGDGGNVRTMGALNFPQPLPFELERWNIPTNLIHEPTVSFTAIQGITAWLSSLKIWPDLQVGPPPSQLFFWSQSGLPIMTFCAASLPDASNRVDQITENLVNQANPWLTNNGIGRFERATNFNGVVWSDVVIATPFLKSIPANGGDFAFAGLESDLNTNRPAPVSLFHQVVTSTNLVAYDWELTGLRIEHWLYFGQLLRFALHHSQVPPKSASFAWLTALETKLGNCGTVVVRTGPAQLSFVRNSGIGLTSAELDLLADWLESPRFPYGLNTFTGEPTPLPLRKSRRPAAPTATNAVPPGPR